MDNSNQWRKRMARGVMTLMFAAVPMQGMFAQVTLNTPNTTLGVVIKKIQAQSEFKFFYDDDLSDMRVKAINVKDAALEKVLAQLLKDKGVTFKVDDKVVYLKRAQLPRQQTRRGGEKRKITGRILDENGDEIELKDDEDDFIPGMRDEMSYKSDDDEITGSGFTIEDVPVDEDDDLGTFSANDGDDYTDDADKEEE